MLFEIEAAELSKRPNYDTLAAAAVEYGLVCERFRRVAKESNAASADLDACLSQLNELQLAMDHSWASFKTRLAQMRKEAGEHTKVPEPPGLFTTKDKSRRQKHKRPMGPPRE